jgi:plastocyanin
MRWAGVLLALAACGAPRPVTHRVEIETFRFAPDTLRVEMGDTVVWTNHDLVPHTATAEAWDSGPIARDGTGRWVAARKGAQSYICAYHPTMHGVVIVQ